MGGAGPDQTLLLPPGLPLEEGRRLLADHGDVLIDDVEPYIKASIVADEQRTRRRTMAAVAVFLVVAAFALFAGWQWLRAERQTSEAALQKDRAERNEVLAEREGDRAAQPMARELRKHVEEAQRLTVEQFARVMQEAGFRAEIVRRENNRPYVRTGLSGRRVAVYLYDCNPEGCRSVQYSAIFTKDPRFTVALSNDWNARKRFVKTYIDADGDLVVEWDVDMDGGVTQDFVTRSILTFERFLGQFDSFVPSAGRRDALCRGTPSGLSAGAPGIARLAELLLDADQLVVLGEPVGARAASRS